MVLMIKFFKSKSAFSIIMMIVTAAYIGFIWFNSTMNAEESTVESLSVLDFLNNLLKSVGLGDNLTDNIVRKSAHFCEFALLGCLSTWTGWLLNKRIIRNLTTIGFVCLATAVVDEYIQLFSAGRSAQIDDVLLDFSGAVAGFVFFLLVHLIVRTIKKAKR